MTSPTYSDDIVVKDSSATVSGRLKAARVGLILIPIFFLAVMGLAMAGFGASASVDAADTSNAAAEAADPAVIAAIEAALPDGTTPAKRVEIIEAVEDTYEAEAEVAEQGGGALGALFLGFLVTSLLVFITGIWTLLAARAPKFVRGLGLVAMPLMLLFGLSTSGFAVVALNEEPEERRRPFNTLAVMAGEARVDDVRLSVRTQGETEPQVEIDLVPEVGGKIVYVSPNFIAGGIFRRGETLVRIDPADFKVAVVSAEANLANAQQALAREIAEGELAMSDLRDFGVDDPSTLARRQPQRQQAEAAVRAAQAEVERAKLQLGRTSVRAPFDGRVRTKSADIGQFVSPGSRLGQIFSTDVVQVRLPLTDADLGKLDLPIAFVARSADEALPVTLSANVAGERRQWNASIVRTDASYDTQTRALFAIAEVRDPYGAGIGEAGVPLAPGLFVDAVVQGRALEDVIVLPRDGLRPESQVYVVDREGRAEARTVRVIDTSPERAVLQPGVIAAGELVVLSPLEESRLATPLRVMDANDPRTIIVEPKRPGRDGENGADDSAERPARPTPEPEERSRDRDTDGDDDASPDAALVNTTDDEQ